MNRLVAEKPTDARTAVQIHLASAFGSDQEIGAVAAAVADGQRVQVSLPGEPDVFGFFGQKPVTYRASIQIAGHKRPVRHLVVISKDLFATTLGCDGQARRTILYDDSAAFILHRPSALARNDPTLLTKSDPPSRRGTGTTVWIIGERASNNPGRDTSGTQARLALRGCLE